MGQESLVCLSVDVRGWSKLKSRCQWAFVEVSSPTSPEALHWFGFKLNPANTDMIYSTHKSTVYHCRHCAIYQFAILYFLAPKMHGYPDHLKVSPIAEMSMLMDLALDKVGKPGLWAFQDLSRKACHLLCRHIVHVFSCLVVSNMRVSVFTMVHLRAY